eukprot:3941352-Rhodomonas_salina.1
MIEEMLPFPPAPSSFPLPLPPSPVALSSSPLPPAPRAAAVPAPPARLPPSSPPLPALQTHIPSSGRKLRQTRPSYHGTAKSKARARNRLLSTRCTRKTVACM